VNSVISASSPRLGNPATKPGNRIAI
jgi:hypothetical protein